MDPGAEQRLIDINVAETGDQMLVEEYILDFAGSPPQLLVERLAGQSAVEGFGSESTVEARDLPFVDE